MRLASLAPLALLCCAFQCKPVTVTAATPDTSAPDTGVGPTASDTEATTDAAWSLEGTTWAYTGTIPGTTTDGGCFLLSDGHLYVSDGEHLTTGPTTEAGTYTATMEPGGFLINLRYTWNPVVEHAAPRVYTGFVVVSDPRTSTFTTLAVWPCEVD